MAEKNKKNYLEEDKKNQLALAIDNAGYVKTPAYWESTLFSEVYLNNDLKRDFKDKWVRDYDDMVFNEDGDSVKSGFAHFYNEFRNIAPALRNLSNRKLSETDTITKIIAPLLDALGWYNNCQNNVEEPYAGETSFNVKRKGNERDKVFRTDMLLVNFPQEAAYISDSQNSDKRKKEARQYCIAPLEAKYWNRITDKEGNKKLDKKRADKKADDTGASLSFNEQVLNYMNILHKKWGIVSDGNTWRLVHHEISGESPERCFQFKLESLLSKELRIEDGERDDGEFLENAKYFYLFFGKASFVADENGKIFLDEVLKESRKYIDSIEEDLKDRFISAMNFTCDGFLRVAKDKGTISDPTEKDLKLIRTVAESHLFNILFIKSCEARSVLPTKAPDYYKISLTSIIDRISVFDPEKYIKSRDKDYINQRLKKSLNGLKYTPEGTGLYKNLIKLTEVIHDGTEKFDYGFEIKGFKESIFSKEEWSFAKKHQLNDEDMIKILFQLGYSKSEKALQRNYQQIPYNYFTARQLGSIYESFLEYQLDLAAYPMVYMKKGKYRQWLKLTSSIQKKLKGFEPIVKSGQLCFTPDNTERKATGSYYTPDYIVQYIINNTLESICEGKNSHEILNLKVCDPSMGSGHFLIGVLNYLTKKYLNALESEVIDTDLPNLSEAKRIVLDRCIFGVDLNARAVKLAKMSLWLESAYPGKKLERLDDQLIEHDALVGDKLWSEYPKIQDAGFDAVVSNPPYLGIKGNSDKIGYLRNIEEWKHIVTNKYDLFYFFIRRSLDFLKKGGGYGVITTSYWPTADGAEKLRREVLRDSSLTKQVYFNDIKLFKEAEGQHNLISFFKKEKASDKAVVIHELSSKDKSVELESMNANYIKDLLESGLIEEQLYESQYSSRNLLENDIAPWNIRIANDGKSSQVFSQMLSNSKGNLSDWFYVHSGIETGSDKVTKKHIEKYEIDGVVGDGIFVLSKEEVEGLNLSASEKKKYIRKFFKNSDITNPYLFSNESKNYLIHFFNGKLDKKSKVYKHLLKYKKILCERYKYKTEDRLEWFDLHRPLSAKYLDEKKIVSPYRTKNPVFALSKKPFYSSIDVFYTVPKNKKSQINIALCILNSSAVKLWLSKNGKMKGDIFELYATPLKSIPFTNESIVEEEISCVVEKILSNKDVQLNIPILDALSFIHYGISKDLAIEVMKELGKDSAYINNVIDGFDFYFEAAA